MYGRDSSQIETSKSQLIPNAKATLQDPTNSSSSNTADLGVAQKTSARVDFDTRGMSEKKIHEVRRLSEFVHVQCEEQGCNTIVDVGSGLVS